MLIPFLILYCSSKIHSAGTKNSFVDVAINGPVRYRYLILIVFADMKDWLSVKHKRRNQIIQPSEFFWSKIDPSTAFRKFLTVLIIGINGIVIAFCLMAALPRGTTVTDIRSSVEPLVAVIRQILFAVTVAAVTGGTLAVSADSISTYIFLMEEKSKEIAARMNYMADMAFDRGNGATLLKMIYAVLKACGETGHPKDTYFSILQDMESTDIGEIQW